MPSTQTPPILGDATRPDRRAPAIDRRDHQRVDAGASVHARLRSAQGRGYHDAARHRRGRLPRPRPPRFDVVYHLFKMPTSVAIDREVGTPSACACCAACPSAKPTLPTATDLWTSADWAEREIFDLFGIMFDGHPDMRRIQMPNDWEGYPLRKDYPLRGPARERSPRPPFALKTNVAPARRLRADAEALQKQIARAETARTRSGAQAVQCRASARRRRGRHDELAAPHKTGRTCGSDRRPRLTHRRSSSARTTRWCSRWARSIRRPTACCRSCSRSKARSSSRPSPRSATCTPGIEKSAENLFWSQAQTVIERMDYLAPLEQRALLRRSRSRSCSASRPDSRRARRQIRVLLAELTRIASHCVWLGTGGIDLGALPCFSTVRPAREHPRPAGGAGGARMHPNYMRVGGSTATCRTAISRSSTR